MRRIAAEVELDGRVYSLVVDSAGGRVTCGWYIGNTFVGTVTALEQAIGLVLEQKRKELVKVSCDKDKSKDCFDCPCEDCPNFWGAMFAHPFQVRDDDKELLPESQRKKEQQVMPSKKDLKKAEAKGYSPYAIVQSMVNRGKLAPSKKESAVKKVTASIIKGKGHGKRGGGKCK